MDWAKSISMKLNGRKMTGKILMTQPSRHTILRLRKSRSIQ